MLIYINVDRDEGAGIFYRIPSNRYGAELLCSDKAHHIVVGIGTGIGSGTIKGIVRESTAIGCFAVPAQKEI